MLEFSSSHILRNLEGKSKIKNQKSKIVWAFEFTEFSKPVKQIQNRKSKIKN